MGLKKRNTVSAEFNMSSLTDIIFLLLIFFMLTSTFVQIQASNLPISDSKTVAASQLVINVDRSGAYTYEGQELSTINIEREIYKQVAEMTKEERLAVTLTIAADKDTSFDYVIELIKIAERLKIKAILATQPAG